MSVTVLINTRSSDTLTPVLYISNIKARLLIALYSGAVSVTYCINDFIAAIRLFIVKTKAVLIFKIIF